MGKKIIFYADDGWFTCRGSLSFDHCYCSRPAVTPASLLPKVWWAFWKKIEKVRTRNIAQYNSWFLDVPDWVPTAESLTCLELHSDVLCYFNEEDWKQRDEGYLSPNHAGVCARKPVVCWGCQSRVLVCTLGETVSPLSCAPLSQGLALLSIPFHFFPSRCGQEDVVPLS